LPWIGKVRLQDITAIDYIWCSLLISFAMYYVVSDLIQSPDSKNPDVRSYHERSE
jgi:hypothetical protein